MPSQYEPLRGATVDNEWQWQPRARPYFILLQGLALAAVAGGIAEVVFQTMVYREIDSSGNNGGFDGHDQYTTSSSNALWAAGTQLGISFLVVYLLWSGKKSESNPRARLYASFIVNLVAVGVVFGGLTVTYSTYGHINYIKDDPTAPCIYYKSMHNSSSATPIPTPLCKACRLTSPPTQSLCCCCSGPGIHGNGTMSYFGVSSCESVFGWISTAVLASQRIFLVSLVAVSIIFTLSQWLAMNCHRNSKPICGPPTENDPSTTGVISDHRAPRQTTSRGPQSAARQPSDVHVQTKHAPPPDYPDMGSKGKAIPPNQVPIHTGYGAKEPPPYQQGSA